MAQGFTSGTTLQVTGTAAVATLQEQTFGWDGLLVAGVGSMRWYTSSAKTLKTVRTSVGTPSSSGVVDVDALMDASTVFTTTTNRPEIAESGYVSSAETPDVVAFAAGSYIQIEIVDAGTGAEDLTVVITYEEE